MSKQDDKHRAEDFIALLNWVSNTFHHHCLQFWNE